MEGAVGRIRTAACILRVRVFLQDPVGLSLTRQTPVTPKSGAKPPTTAAQIAGQLLPWFPAASPAHSLLARYSLSRRFRAGTPRPDRRFRRRSPETDLLDPKLSELLLDGEMVLAECDLLNTNDLGVLSVTNFQLLFVSKATKSKLGTIPLTAIEQIDDDLKLQSLPKTNM